MPTINASVADGSLFRSLFTAYPDALLVADAAGCIVLANPSAAALLGYEADELAGMNVDALVPDSIRPQHGAYRQDYGSDPKPRPMGMQMDLVARRKDGSEVRVEIALSPIKTEGRPLVVAAIRDIGSYPRVKQALQRARYSDHLAQLGRMAVHVRNPEELLQLAPQIAAAALEVDTATVHLLGSKGLPLRMTAGFGAVMGAAGSTGVADAADATFSGGSALDVPLLDRDRVIGVLSVRCPQPARFGEDELHFLESLANLLVTSLQRAKTEEALNHAQRLESVGQLTGGIAHDFNNLLTVIQGNLQVLEELPVLAGQAHAQQLVTAASRASKRGAELTGKLLAFARRQVLQPSAVDVNALLLSLADLLQRTLDQHIEITVDAPPCPLCLADAGQLESALLNIAINARDAMPDGGRLRFQAAPCAALPPDALGGIDELPRVSGAQGAFVAISVTDSGTGMSAEVQEHAFEPFFTTKELGRGTGLGLSTVYGFVKQSRGGVTLSSTPGVGTTVRLFIPSVAEDAEPTKASAEAAAALRTEADHVVTPGLRVLLVEDDHDVRTVIEMFLQTLGCAVTALASGEQALHALQAVQMQAGEKAVGRYDLLLTDIALGTGMRGTELARLAQDGNPGLCVLLMSGYSSELLAADRDSPPTWELLRKPCTRAELARAITLVTATQTHTPTHAA